MQLYITTLPTVRGQSPVRQGPFEATPERVTDELLGLKDTSKVMRLNHDADTWLEVGWHKKGYVMRERYEGTVYYSDEPNSSAEETAEQVAEYLKGSIADIDEWFKADSSTDEYQYITSRTSFELIYKRYRLQSFVAVTLAGLLLLFMVIVTLVITLMIVGSSHIVLIAIAVPVGLFFLKFDLRGKKKKGKRHYHPAG